MSDRHMEKAREIAGEICCPDLPYDSDVEAIAAALREAERDGMRRAAEIVRRSYPEFLLADAILSEAERNNG